MTRRWTPSPRIPAIRARARTHLPSTEREGERLHAGLEELDVELSIGYPSRLSNQLIQALLGDRAFTGVLDVTSMARAWRLSIE